MRTRQIVFTIVVCVVALVAGCRIYTLDTFYFDPEAVDRYFQLEDIEDYYHIHWVIPDTLVDTLVLDVGGNDVYAFFIKAPDTIQNPVTVIYSHGNDKNINRFWRWAELLWECGYNVYIYDYEGYGRSEGDPSDEACFRDMRASVDYVRGRSDVDVDRIVYMGLSMGTFVSVYAAAEYRKPSCVILESPPASTEALVHDSYLLGIPASYVSDAPDFDSEKRIKNIGVPLFIMAGDDDDYVVFERNGSILYDKAHEPKTLWLVPEAKHSDIKEVAGYATFKSRITQFVDTHVP